MDSSYPKSVRLRSRRQYLRMNGNASRRGGVYLVIDAIKNGEAFSRLGITVTKRYGDAHKRNRFKRIVREAFRLCRHQLLVGFDLNIKPRTKAETATMNAIMAEIIELLSPPVSSDANVPT